jgi:lysozyme
MLVHPKVIDLSHWDDVEDHFVGAVRSGIKGVINKVTEGYGGRDASFGWRRQPAKDAGLLYGAYHFIRPGPVPRQVDWFLQSVGDPAGLLLALDHEDRNVPLANAQLFCQIIYNKLGRWPKLYSGFLIKEQINHANETFWKQIPLWLSHYNANPTWPHIWAKPWLWQYTGDGIGPGPHGVPGITPSSKLDMNSYDGSDTQLAQEWAGDAKTPAVA